MNGEDPVRPAQGDSLKAPSTDKKEVPQTHDKNDLKTVEVLV